MAQKGVLGLEAKLFHAGKEVRFLLMFALGISCDERCEYTRLYGLAIFCFASLLEGSCWHPFKPGQRGGRTLRPKSCPVPLKSRLLPPPPPPSKKD